MQKVILGLIIIIGVLGLVYSQETVKNNNVKINKSKPSVYLSFEGTSKNQSPQNCDCEDSETFLLSLHNNTERPINVFANFDVRKVTSNPITLSDGVKAVS